MNAYELADDAKNIHTTIEALEFVQKAVPMLRQQANRIAELEKEVKRLVGAEPITHGKITFCKNCGQQDPYTQTKPLSDEEIIKIFNQIWNAGGNTNGVMHRFARAIEERHGIK